MRMRYQTSPPVVHLWEDVTLHPTAPVDFKTLFLPMRTDGLTSIPSSCFPNHTPRSKMKWYPFTTASRFTGDFPFYKGVSPPVCLPYAALLTPTLGLLRLMVL